MVFFDLFPFGTENREEQLGLHPEKKDQGQDNLHESKDEDTWDSLLTTCIVGPVHPVVAPARIINSTPVPMTNIRARPLPDHQRC